MSDQKLGPDGTFPLGGPQFPGDMGGIKIAFTINPNSRHAAMMFGDTSLSMLAGTPPQIKFIAEHIRKEITDKFGDVPYDVKGLPIRVEATPDRQLVKIHLLGPAAGVVANIEAFLALAERMTEEANKCLN
jgi:hypothetical protein